MKLTREASAILAGASIGMLALPSGRLPLVNPAVYSFANGSVWMTTSRYAAKTIIAKRDPRAAFLVDGGAKAVLVRGALEVFDPLSLSSDVRAVLEGPGYFLGMAGSSPRNPPVFAGNPPCPAKAPREWLASKRGWVPPQPSEAELVGGGPFPPGQPAPGPP